MAKQKSLAKTQFRGNNTTENYLENLVREGAAKVRKTPSKEVEDKEGYMHIYSGYRIYTLIEPPITIESHDCWLGFGNLVYKEYILKGPQKDISRYVKVLEGVTKG